MFVKVKVVRGMQEKQREIYLFIYLQEHAVKTKLKALMKSWKDQHSK